MNASLKLLAVAALVGASGLAAADTKTADLNVLGAVTATCDDLGVTGGTLTVPSTAQGAASTSGTARVEVKCGTGVPYSLSYSYSGNKSGTQRRMKSGTSTNYLAYTLLGNSTADVCTTGSDVAGGSTAKGSTTVAQAMLPGAYTTNEATPTYLCAAVTAAQTAAAVPATDYTDTVTVTLNY